MDNYLGNGFDFAKFIGKTPKNNTCCPDQIVGQLTNGAFIQSSRQSIDYVGQNHQLYINNKITDPIAIVLESPHKSEYIGAPGPAKGSTGVLFFKKFQSMINKSSLSPVLQTGTHSVILMNAIQYQCSLGHPLNDTTSRAVRDNNWVMCFENATANDICQRLNAIHPVATINLCTKGCCNLQLMLHKEINNYPNYTFGTHPSTWNFPYAMIK